LEVQSLMNSDWDDAIFETLLKHYSTIMGK
jgi:hypothetical protein